MSVPDYQSLMLPLLSSMPDQQETTVGDSIKKIANSLSLSEPDLSELLPSGKQTLIANRLHWAKFYMSKAGLIESTKRGYFKITPRGLNLLNQKPERIDNNLLAQFPEFLEFKIGNQTLSNSNENKDEYKNVFVTDSDVSPEELMETTYLLLKTTLKAEIIESLYSVSAFMFERIIIDLLISMGYGGGRLEMGKAFEKSGDNGVDGVIREDELGLDVVYIQAKKYKAEISVGRPDIQAFVGSLEGFNATKGVFVTTSSFTSTAREYAQKVHKRIVLIDGQELSELMIRHNVGVRPKETYELKKIDEDYYIE